TYNIVNDLAHKAPDSPHIIPVFKVIYALNTKNDEHEDSIQALREAHEEEIQNILAETRETILQCKSKVEEEQLLRKHIQALEIAVAQHKRLKEEALAELILCKKQAEEKESRTEVKQAQTGLSTDSVKKLEADLEEKSQKIDERKKHSQKLKERIQQEILRSKCIVKKEEEDLSVVKERNSHQEKEILHKADDMRTVLNSQSKSVKKADELKHQITQLQQMTCTKERQKKSNSEVIKKSEKEKKIKLMYFYQKFQRQKELQTQLDEFKRKSECELKQLEKEKEVLTGKLQNSSLEVAQLKQILEQQAKNFKESLKKYNLQSNKEKEKLLQDLQNAIKENQNVKLQLEASHQKVLKMLEESKNQELKEAEERLKKEFNETFKIQHQSHRLEIQTLEEKAKKELHDELEQIQKQQALLLGSLRMELSEQQTLCTNLKKQIEELQMELRSVRTLKKQQARGQFVLHCHVEGSSQSQIRSLHDELEKCQSEISELKKENLLLKDTMELLSAELESQKQEATQLQDRDKQHTRFVLNSHLTVLSRDSIIMPVSGVLSAMHHKKELDILKQDHRKEIENIVSDFSSTQAHLQAKIFSLETALKELDEKSRKWESRPEDTHLINCLQDKLSEREEIIKQLVEGRKCQHSLSANTESYRNRSFSFNPNTACLTPFMKQKKTVEVPSRVVSVPNLASYAKSFLSCDLRSKRSAPQITKSTSLDRSSGCLRVGSPSTQSSDSSAATRTHGNEPPQTKDDQKQDPQHQEWFT
ncbi:hypothetical protein IHE44_0012927, partial [Lamprotornis superbus]